MRHLIPREVVAKDYSHWAGVDVLATIIANDTHLLIYAESKVAFWMFNPLGNLVKVVRPTNHVAQDRTGAQSRFSNFKEGKLSHLRTTAPLV